VNKWEFSREGKTGIPNTGKCECKCIAACKSILDELTLEKNWVREGGTAACANAEGILKLQVPGAFL
jgi:hypothetical protein